jgi:hypothetical protein
MTASQEERSFLPSATGLVTNSRMKYEKDLHIDNAFTETQKT